MNSAFRGMVVSATYVPMKEPIVDRIRSHCDNTSIFQDKHTNQTFLVLQIFLLKAKISAMLSTGIRAGGVICEFCFNNATELAINLQSLHKQNGEPLDLSHIYNVDIWIDGALGPVLGQRVIRYQTLPKDVFRTGKCYSEASGRLVCLASKHLGQVQCQRTQTCRPWSPRHCWWQIRWTHTEVPTRDIEIGSCYMVAVR